MLFLQPFTRTEHLQPDAVDQQVAGPSGNMHRFEIDFKLMARPLAVLWSGAFNSKPSSSKIDAIKPSVCRSGWRNTTRNIRLVSMARSKQLLCLPRVVRERANQESMASGRSPQGQTAAGAKCSVIFTPIAHQELHLGNVRAGVDVVFVWNVLDWPL